MQEIIFRGKSIAHHGKKEEWVYGFYSNYKGVNGRTHYISSDNGNSIAVRGETVGQYIGLTDKNGTKIFEGDIATLLTRNWITVKAKFLFVDGSFMVYLLERECLVPEFSIRDISKDIEITVIGNIYDNPELAKI